MNKNPFNPAFGKVPPIFIDREELVRNVIDGLGNLDSPWQTTMISGIRGVGKTVLLADICQVLEKDPHWIVADIPSNGNIMETLVETVREKASSDVRKALDSIEGFSVSILGIGIGYTAERTDANYQLLLEKILKKLQEKGISLLVAIDEVSSGREIRLFASVYQIMLRKNYPIALLMTGLPKNISELQNSKTLTFLLRSARIELPLLNTIAVHYSYQSAFSAGGKTISEEVLKRITELTCGYSYAFQLLGYLLWNTGADVIDDPLVEQIMPKYKEQLFRNAYYKIYDELSQTDRSFVRIMAQSEDNLVPMKYISDLMDKKPNYISTYKRRLLENGVITAKSYGHVAFSLPMFREYVRQFHI